MNAEEEKLKERIAEIKEWLTGMDQEGVPETNRERFRLQDELKEKERQLRALSGEPAPDPDDEKCEFCSLMGGRKKTRRRKKAKRGKTTKRGRTAKRRKMAKRRKTAKRGKKTKRGKKAKGRRTKKKR